MGRRLGQFVVVVLVLAAIAAVAVRTMRANGRGELRAVLQEQAAQGLIVSLEELLDSYPSYDEDRTRQLHTWLETRGGDTPMQGGQPHPEPLFLAQHLPAVQAWIKVHPKALGKLQHQEKLATRLLPRFEDRTRRLLAFLDEGPVHLTLVADMLAHREALLDVEAPHPEWSAKVSRECFAALWWLDSALVAGDGNPDLLDAYDVLLANRRHVWWFTDVWHPDVRAARDRAHVVLATAELLAEERVASWADEPNPYPRAFAEAARNERVSTWVRSGRAMLAGRSFESVFGPWDTRTKIDGWLDGFSLVATVVRLMGIFERTLAGSESASALVAAYEKASFGWLADPDRDFKWYPGTSYFSSFLDGLVRRSGHHALKRAGLLLLLASRRHGRPPRDDAEARAWLGPHASLFDPDRWSPGLRLVPREDGCLVIRIRPHARAGIFEEAPSLLRDGDPPPRPYEARGPYDLLRYAHEPRFAAAACILAPSNAK